MSASMAANVHLPPDCDVAIVGAGPVGLMLANLLGAAGVNVVVLERNGGLVGLPRAIAYDAETLRLFAQVGLFDRIAVCPLSAHVVEAAQAAGADGKKFRAGVA